MAGGPVRTVLMAGEDLVEARIEPPVRLLDAPPPAEPLADHRTALRRALAAPRGLPPIHRLVGPGARVAVAFDDPCLPLPPPVHDPRRACLEAVLDELAAAGVRHEDVDLICAGGLHRHWTRAELLPLVGPRVMRRYGDRLRCYDGEDPEGNVRLAGPDRERVAAATPAATPAVPAGVGPVPDLIVEVDRAVAEADLVVYVAVPWLEMNGGHKSLACGASTYASIRQHHGPEVQRQSPLMDPVHSEMHHLLRRIGAVIGSGRPVLQVETVVNNRVWAGPLRLLDTRRPALPLPVKAARRLPARARGLLRRGMVGWYQPVGVRAGTVDAVHDATLEQMATLRAGPVAPADILVLPVPDESPYAVHSAMNPVLAANLGLGYVFQFGRGRPLVRRGGRVILVSPLRPGFHPRHHVAYRRFWDEVLPHTRDADVMASEFEPAFVADPGLVAAYRFDQAYHPAHPFFIWYWMERARRHLGGVTVAGAVDAAAAEVMGFDAAPDVETAVAAAREELGRDAEVLVHRIPPAFTVDVA